jgi:hypothetical protein
VISQYFSRNFDFLNEGTFGYCVFFRPEQTEKELHCNNMDRLGGGKSAAMYSRDEEYIMLAFSIEKCAIDIIKIP